MNIPCTQNSGSTMRDILRSQKLFAMMLGFIFIANIMDAFFTLGWVEMNAAEEANPLMAYLLDVDPLLFWWTKFVVVFIALMGLWALRQHILARVLTLIVSLVYMHVIILHMNAF